MNDIEFQPWQKIGRGSPFNVTVTEKIDGTNGCIVIQDGDVVAVQSRKRFITPDDDNFGFARWVDENKDDLLSLGDGHHYGEWAGPGIQKNPHNLDRKTFFLFNTFRWNDDNPNRPQCCSVVPVLYQGELTPTRLDFIMAKLLHTSEQSGYQAEGVIVYYHSMRTYSKHTYQNSEGKWRNA